MLFIDLVIDASHLSNPALPLPVFHRHNLLVCPVKVIGDIGYLLKQALGGVAYDSPKGTVSTSNSP